MTGNREFSSSRKRVHLFIYEFEKYYSGEPSVSSDNRDFAVKEECGFFLILVTILLVISLVLLGIDLALAPAQKIKDVSTQSQPQIPARRIQNPSRGEHRLRSDNFQQTTNQMRGPSSLSRENPRDRLPPLNTGLLESTRGAHPPDNTSVSYETSFTSSPLRLRAREFWL